MTNVPPPFGTYFADTKTQKRISFCRGLHNNWFHKQMAQLIRKRILKKINLPLDIHLDGIKLRCFLKDNVCERNYVFMPWRYDVLEREEMLKCLPKDGVFIDIGANIGIYSTLAAQYLSKKGCVVAIEPNPPVFSRLTFNLSATTSESTNTPKIVTLMQGISDCATDLELFLDDANLGASSILANHNKTTSIKIRCETLLQVVESQKLCQVDVIKCDIEGAEDRALIPFLTQAPEQLLPRCIIFENNSQHWHEDLLSTLVEAGYKLFAQTRLNFIYKRNNDLK